MTQDYENIKFENFVDGVEALRALIYDKKIIATNKSFRNDDDYNKITILKFDNGYIKRFYPKFYDEQNVWVAESPNMNDILHNKFVII